MKRILTIISVGAILISAVFLFQNQLRDIFARLEGQVLPCANPIAYTIGTFDSRFGISKSAFLGAISQAEAIWEKPAGKNLFEYAQNGNLKINLVYDFRQEATQKLKSLGITVGSDKISYDALKSKYNAMQADYLNQKSVYDSRVAAFQIREKAYESAVSLWNKQRSVSRDAYNQLNTEKAWLVAENAAIGALQASLNAEAADINAIIVPLNRLAIDLNLNVDQFNAIGQVRGAEFEEGAYKTDASGEEIDIYQFDTNARLVRVLAHELGHALGLAHVADPRAIMYRLNESLNATPTTADLSELKTLCGL